MTTNDSLAADLERQAQEAEAHARQLEQRVLDGDEDVTHEQISEARARSGFLRLRAKGKRERDEHAMRQERLAAVRALTADVLALAPSSPLRPASKEAAAATKSVAAAFGKYLAAMDLYDEQVTALRRRALDLGVTFGSDEVEGLRDQGSSLLARASDGTPWAVERSWPAARERALQDLLREAMNSLPAEVRVRL